MMKQGALLTLLSVTLLAACGKGPVARETSRSGSIECVDSDCRSGDTFTVKPQKVEGIVNQRQLLPHFQKCLNLTNSQVSATTKTTYKEAIGSLSLDGNAADLSAPMLMSITKVASEMCRDLINAETSSNSRTYFPGFTLGSFSNTQAFDLAKTLNTLAIACWGRELSSKEKTIITDEIKTSKNQNAALFACTAVLSSAQALRF